MCSKSKRQILKNRRNNSNQTGHVIPLDLGVREAEKKNKSGLLLGEKALAYDLRGALNVGIILTF